MLGLSTFFEVGEADREEGTYTYTHMHTQKQIHFKSMSTWAHLHVF